MLDRSQGENLLFGYGDGSGAHFDAVMAELLAGTDYEEAFAEDLARVDTLGNSVEYRVNLALALEAYGADVDFETVWGQAHVEAERTGDSTTNFIAWVVECCQ